MARTKLRGDVRRDQIVHAALAIIAEHGTGSLSVARVAELVGIAPSALYRHYPDKNAMVADLLERLAAKMQANLDLALAAAPENALAALEELLQRHVRFIQENRGFPLLFFSDFVTQHPERRHTLLANFDRFLGDIARILREGQRQGRVRPDLHPESGALAFMGLFVPSALYWHLAGDRFDLPRQVLSAWTVYVAGIRTPGTHATVRAVRPRLTRPRGRRRAQEPQT